MSQEIGAQIGRKDVAVSSGADGLLASAASGLWLGLLHLSSHLLCRVG
jgi:hypothetical protein